MSQELSVLGSFTPYGLQALPAATGDAKIQGSEALYFLFETDASEHRLDEKAWKRGREEEEEEWKRGKGGEGVFAEVKGEEEVLVSGQTVIWSSAGTIRKSFTIPHRVKQAMLVSFAMNERKGEEMMEESRYANDLVVLHDGTFSGLS